MGNFRLPGPGAEIHLAFRPSEVVNAVLDSSKDTVRLRTVRRTAPSDVLICVSLVKRTWLDSRGTRGTVRLYSISGVYGCLRKPFGCYYTLRALSDLVEQPIAE